MTTEYKCLACGEPCEIVAESFDYAGTHCTNGRGGTHYTGYHYSACCSAEFEEIEDGSYMLHSRDYDDAGEPRIYHDHTDKEGRRHD